jgi:hypothetical protein
MWIGGQINTTWISRIRSLVLRVYIHNHRCSLINLLLKITKYFVQCLIVEGNCWFQLFFYISPAYSLQFLQNILMNSTTAFDEIKHEWKNNIYALHIIILIQSLTQLRSWALLEKLPILQLLKNFPAFYGTGKFDTVFTRARH